MFCHKISINILVVLVVFQFCECSAFMSWFYSSGESAKNVRGSSSVIDYGECSHYGDSSENDAIDFRTQSGELFNPNDLTAAHRTLPINSYVRVINEATKQTVVVRINDRGPNVDGRVLELSPSAFNQIADLDEAVITCIVEMK